MDTTDAHLKEGGFEGTGYWGDVVIRFPCSGFADFLYSNRTLQDWVFEKTRLFTTYSNVVKGAAANCKGCALVYDAVTTFKRERLPMDDCSIYCYPSRGSPDPKMLLNLYPARRKTKDEISSIKPVAASYPDENCVREYLEYGLSVRLELSRGK